MLSHLDQGDGPYWRFAGGPLEAGDHARDNGRVEVRLLGPFEVVSGTTPVKISGAKSRTLLAVLAAQLNRVVGTDELIECLWERGAPPAAAATLQTYVYQLRRALPANVIVTRG